jgi:tetratricopeptide (TPR) repeat protein
MAAWIERQSLTGQDIQSLESLDLTGFIRETAHIDLAPTERLRCLAIALESRLGGEDQPRGWLALERIYAAGRALGETDADIEISRAITAAECGFWLDNRPEIQRRMMLAGRDAAARALEFEPGDAHAHYVLGMLEYSFPDGSLDSALARFQEAIAIEPTHSWARLYRAHCLHDLGRWSDAARAYADVDPGFFVGQKAWRYDLLREQRAWCLLHAGDHAHAVAEFLTVLHRYEAEPRLAENQLLRELRAAAEGPLKAELSDRFTRLCQEVERRRINA